MKEIRTAIFLLVAMAAGQCSSSTYHTGQLASINAKLMFTNEYLRAIKRNTEK